MEGVLGLGALSAKLGYRQGLPPLRGPPRPYGLPLRGAKARPAQPGLEAAWSGTAPPPPAAASPAQPCVAGRGGANGPAAR